MRRRAGLALAGAGLALIVVLIWRTSPGPLPEPEAVRAAYTPSEAWLLDRNGQVLQVQRLDFHARRLPWLPLAEVSPALRAAVVQAEDHRFATHAGVDALALLAALRDALRQGHARGASTITMQLAGLLDPSLAAPRGGRRWLQKLRQMRAAWQLERSWSKDEILEAWLNLAGFRGELQGLSAASRALFNKQASGLDQPESLLLAALLPAPAATPQAVADRACRLARHQAPDLDCASLQQLARSKLATPGGIAGEPDYAPHLAQRLLSQPGEHRRTTLDLQLQQLAIDALRQQLLALTDRQVRDAAAVVVDNASGEVLAYVGGVNVASRAAQVDNARALRQAGSTLKPFLYAQAIEKRYLTAASLLDDSPVRLQTGNGLYIPQDYDREFRGLVSLRSALAGSLNVPAVRTQLLVGGDAFLDRLHAVGYGSIAEPAEHYGYSLALGSAEVTLLEQVNAFRTLANGGRWSPLRLSPEDVPSESLQAIDPATAWIIGDILSDRGSRALSFGLDSSLVTPFWSAVKTGTSKFMRDNWAIGYSRRYTVGVWVGNADGEAMQNVSGVTGAAPAWLQIMTGLPQARPDAAPAAPAGIVETALRYGDAIEPARREWFLAGTEMSRVEAAPALSLRPRLESPAGGMLVALDPDIPAARQQILFRAEPRLASLHYQLDGKRIGKADRARFWSPEPGRHRLELVDADGLALDVVEFEVRAPPARAAAGAASRSSAAGGLLR